MATLKLKYVHRFKDRHGKWRAYFRRPGYRQVPLPGLPGSAEFMQAYQSALGGESGRMLPGQNRAIAGSISAAVAGYLQSIEYLSLAPATKNTYRRALDRFRTEHGDKPVRSLQAHHIKTMMAAKADAPNAANFLVDTIRLIMKYAIERGWRRDDPTVGIKKIKIKSDGWHAWTETEIEQYEGRWPVGSTQRLAFDLLLHTGQRSADVRQMTRGQITRDLIQVRQQKTGEWLLIPITPELQASLEKVSKDQIVLLLTSYGKPFTERGFGNFVVKAARAAGLPQGCSPHGLRKAAATRLAEAGCTNHQIMAITGHRTMQEVERYTRSARQGVLAREALEIMRRSRENGP